MFNMFVYQMDRIDPFSPTPSHAQPFAQPVYYDQSAMYAGHMEPALAYEMGSQAMSTPHGHQMVHGRIVVPSYSSRSSHTPHVQHRPEECDPSPFLPEDGMSPFGHPVELPSASDASSLMMNQHIVSPTERIDPSRQHGSHIHRNNSLPLSVHHQNPSFPPQRLQRTNSHNAQGRPNMTRGNTLQVPPRPAPLHRQASLHVASARSASPHKMAGDIFDPTPGSPVKRPSTTLGLVMDQHGHSSQQAGFDLRHSEMVGSWSSADSDVQFFNGAQGISPARALGPAPTQPLQFSSVADDPMITPHGHKTGYESTVHSSAHSSSVASSSSSIDSSNASSVEPSKRRSLIASENENESPTRAPSAARAMQKMQLNEKTSGQEKNAPSRPMPIVVRPQRPIVNPVTSGGRTSAKFAKVAEDPGVEGIPPGPRPVDRPGPSFACIIGQAILKCQAGGLSLEHIYRFVETAYPYFKNGDGAWRNSVRHNLSIHKMFETIPRTEKFPPGKGGIWIIHEDEKCHWPEENKFIKNFPSSHPHHAVCRQTLHERAKEKDAIDKAAREGREYIPKKGKKGRKLPNKDDEDSVVEMMRTSSDIAHDHHPMVHFHPQLMAPPMQPLAGPSSATITPTMQTQPLPPPYLATSDHSSLEFEDDGDFLPMEPEITELAQDTTPPDVILSKEDRMARGGVMVPPRFERDRKEKRRVTEDEENVFTSTKRQKSSESRISHPLAPLLPLPQESVLDDSFITPERERPVPSAKAMMSSAFKTPALVNTSSSPGSSPMPPTITRTTHHPSALQQTWTHDDMAETGSNNSSPQRPMLESAFDLQPKTSKTRTRALVAEDDYPITSTTLPKTPLSRSSASRDTNRTPGNGILSKTPISFGRSPAQPPPTVSALLSTPMWEMGGCLDRLKDHGCSPTHSIRSPMPPTSPTRYAMLLGSASPAARKIRDFSL